MLVYAGNMWVAVISIDDNRWNDGWKIEKIDIDWLMDCQEKKV